MRVITSLLTLLLLAALPNTFAREGELLVQGMLVVASNKPGTIDAKLSPYEPNLKKVLRFASYRIAGKKSTVLTVPNLNEIAIGQKHRLEIEGLSADRDLVRVRLKWTENKRELMNTTLRLIRGTPAVLGGPQVGNSGDVFAIIVLVL